MSKLGLKPNKQVNFVWIHSDPKLEKDAIQPINALGGFNAVCWLLCGWNVRVIRHASPGKELPRPFTEPFMQAIQHAKEATQATFTDVTLKTVLEEPASNGMPETREVIRSWMQSKLAGTLPYVIGDITKAFIAGTQHGIVLDTKIGPSPWVDQYPAELLDKFVCASRSGGTVVENQCMGSFLDNSTKAYGAAYDGRPAKFLSGINLEREEGQSIFGGLTNMHSASYSALTKGSKPVAFDIATYGEDSYIFTELQVTANKDLRFQNAEEIKAFVEQEGRGRAQACRGPFRVYQIAGYYNWQQGKYAQARMGNNASVARTLWLEHLDPSQNARKRVHPEPFKTIFGNNYQPIVHGLVQPVLDSLGKFEVD